MLTFMLLKPQDYQSPECHDEPEILVSLISTTSNQCPGSQLTTYNGLYT